MVGSEHDKSLKVAPLAIPDVKLVVPQRHSDSRGYFSETFNRRTLAAAGIAFDSVQDNQSFSAARGTVRGMHFQVPPLAQTKLIRVVRGTVFDVAIDFRRGSPTFGRHVSAVLSAKRGNQLYIPAGFAHGFCTLEPETEVLYKVDKYYSTEHERGFRWDDPDLAIPWPIAPAAAVLSPRDRELPRFRDIEPAFVFEGASGEAAKRTVERSR